jgi:membrane fusion protein (multidrug efflux system)
VRCSSSFQSVIAHGQRRAARWACLTTVVFVCALVYATSGCGRGGKEAPGQRPPTEVTTLTVSPSDVPVTWEYIAQVQSSRQVNIQARVNGFLDKRVYSEGAIVKEGDVLFQMDQKPFQAQLDAAVAALKQQEARLEVARLNLARTKPLTAAHALSQKDLDDANGTFLSAQAAVEQAKADVETARLNLSYTTITSPVTGITGAAAQQDGTYLNITNSQLTTVAVLSPMWVNFSLSENELQKIRDEVAKGLLIAPDKGDYEVDIVLVDGSLFPQRGHITFANFEYNQQTGMFLIRVSVDNPVEAGLGGGQGLLRPNQYVRVRLHGAIRPNAILVPQRAVQQGSKGHFVWVVDKEGKVDARPIVLGDAYSNDWFVYDGLRAGDQVVVDGAITLRPGETVKAAPLATEGAAAPAEGGQHTVAGVKQPPAASAAQADK